MKEWYERKNAAHASNQLCGSCVEEGRLLPLWGTFVLFCRRPRQKFIDVLLSSLGYSSRQNLHTAKSELSSFVTVFFPFYVFPALFFSMNESQAAAEGQSTKQKEQATTAVHDEDDSGQNTSPTMLSILSALQASVASSIKVIVVTFLVKNRKMKLSGESIF